MPLQRAIVDFGADDSFGKTVKKIRIHYRIDLSQSSIRKITLHHAHNIKKLKKDIQKFDSVKAFVDYIIAEADGVMAPIVFIDKQALDKRKGKTFKWCEARLSLAYKKGEIQPIFDASFGSIDEVGDQIAYCVKAAGHNEHSRIHFVGDGAPWIAEQVEKHFGSDASYLIDFCHLTQYLAGASECCSPTNKESWRKSMQALMKEGKLNDLLNELKFHMDLVSDNHECLAVKCYNYIVRRLTQFDYKQALEQDLPIGSGRVESGNRSIIQRRLKITGAWWDKNNAESMLALRVVRENDFIDAYWADHAIKY